MNPGSGVSSAAGIRHSNQVQRTGAEIGFRDGGMITSGLFLKACVAVVQTEVKGKPGVASDP